MEDTYVVLTGVKCIPTKQYLLPAVLIFAFVLRQNSLVIAGGIAHEELSTRKWGHWSTMTPSAVDP
jgi:hypothetical protein